MHFFIDVVIIFMGVQPSGTWLMSQAPLIPLHASSIHPRASPLHYLLSLHRLPIRLSVTSTPD
jgi:hypothetical protein